MSKKKKKPKAFETFPLANTYQKESGSNVSIPTPQDVKDTKDWVDFNQK